MGKKKKKDLEIIDLALKEKMFREKFLDNNIASCARTVRIPSVE